MLEKCLVGTAAKVLLELHDTDSSPMRQFRRQKKLPAPYS
jgi:hypothetical protein